MVDHNRRIHLAEIDLNDVLSNVCFAYVGLIDEASFVGCEQFKGASRFFTVTFLPGHEIILFQSDGGLNHRHGRPRGGARHPLHGNTGEARELNHSFKPALAMYERVVPVDMPPPL